MKRVLHLAALFVLSAIGTFGQNNGSYHDIAWRFVQGFPNFPAPGAVVTVCNYPVTNGQIPCTNLATIYGGPTNSVVMSNPVTADANGNYAFWAPPGNYVITITGTDIIPYAETITLAAVSSSNPLPMTIVPWAGTLSFPGTNSAAYSVALAGNVTSTSIIGSPSNGNLIKFHVCQPGVGGPYTFAFPAGFLNTTAIQTTGCTDETYSFDGNTGNWSQLTQPSSGGGIAQVNGVPLTLPTPINFIDSSTIAFTNPAAGNITAGIKNNSITIPMLSATGSPGPTTFLRGDNTWATTSGGGSGCTPGGNPGDYQTNAGGGNCSAGHINDNGSVNVSSEPFYFGILDPWVDLTTVSNARALPSSSTLINGTLQVTIGASSTTAALSGSPAFINGDYVVIPGAGANCSLSTPSAPTISQVGDEASGTLTYVNGATGATSYSYEVVALNNQYCYTAASASGSTSTGLSSLGTTTTSVSTFSISGNTVTVNFTSAHSLAAGQRFDLYGTSNDNVVGGTHKVANVNSTTQITFVMPRQSTVVNITSGTGGTATYTNANLVTWTAVTNAWEYAIYGPNCPGTCNLLGVSTPSGSNVQGLSWEDYGSGTSLGAFTAPTYLPATAPGSSFPNPLVTTIASGAGTNSLTLNAAATNAVTNGHIYFDNGQALINACNSYPLVKFPVQATGNIFYLYAPLSSLPGCGIRQASFVSTYHTIPLASQTQWDGSLDPQAYGGAQFQWQGTPTVSGTTFVSPLFYTDNKNQIVIRNVLTNTGSNNQAIGYLFDEGVNLTLDNVGATWGTVYNTQGIQLRANSFADAGFMLTASRITVAGGTSTFGPTTPAIFFNNTNLGKVEYLQMSKQGAFLKSNASCSTAFDFVYDQGGTQPLFTLYCANIQLDIRNFTLDTMGTPTIAGLNGVGTITLCNGNSGTGSPEVTGSGLPVSLNYCNGASSPSSQVGLEANSMMQRGLQGMIDGQLNTNSPLSYNNGSYMFEITNGMRAIGNKYSNYSLDAISTTAPTCSVATAGPPFTPAGTWTYQVSYMGPNGGVSYPSPKSSGCTSDGATQQVTVTVPALAGSQIGYSIYKNDGVHNGVQVCATLPCTMTTPTTLVDTTAASGNFNWLPNMATTGPAGFNNALGWAPYLHLGATVSLPSSRGTGFDIGLLAADTFPYLQIGGVKYFWVTLPASVTWTSGQCAQSTSTVNVWTLAACGSGGAGTVTNVSSGNAAPLFTVNVATPSTTPSFTFTISNATANSVFGNCTGSNGAPTYCTLTSAMIPPINLASSANGGVTGLLPNANLANPSLTYNGQAVALGAAGNVNAGATTHSMALNEGAGSAITGLTLGAHQTVIGVVGADPVAKTITDCNGGGNALNYAQSSDTFSCNTISSLAAILTTLGDLVYENATPTPARLPGPTAPNGVPQYLTDTPSSGAAQAEVWALAGVPVNNNSETTCATYTLNVLDRATNIRCSGGSTVTITAPAHSGTGFGSNFPFDLTNLNSGTLTFTTTSPDSVDGGSAGGSQTILSNWDARMRQDGSGNWYTTRVPTFAAFGSNCGDSTHGLAWSTTTGFFCQSISGSGITLQTNSVNNSSQTTLNLLNSTAFNGLTFTFTNTSAGNVQGGFSGTLGNAGLTNSSLSVNGVSISLGGSSTVVPPDNGGFTDATNSSATSLVTIATTPSAGHYLLSYYMDVNSACPTGSTAFALLFQWVDASGTTRSLQTGNLSVSTSQLASSYLEGTFSIWVGSGNVTVTPSQSGACGSGSATYDLHTTLTGKLR